MKYGMYEATELSPKPGRLIAQYHITGSAKKVSEEAGMLEEKLELLQKHLYFQGELGVDVTREGDAIAVRGKYSLYHLINDKLRVSSLGKDNKPRNTY